MIEHARSRGRGSKEGERDYGFCNSISKEEIKDALKKMKTKKAVGPDVYLWKFGNVWVNMD